MDIYEFFERHNIEYERQDHPPVYTCEQADRLVAPMGGAKTKNLFLRDNKGRRHFLVTVDSRKTVDLKALSAVIGAGKLSFGSPQRLEKHLGLEPGAVTILAAVNDPDQTVEFFVDRELWEAEAFQCHPLVNTATLLISKENLERVFDASGHTVKPIPVPVRQPPAD
jgi:Ala-tRNA(Pro) deacylase